MSVTQEVVCSTWVFPRRAGKDRFAAICRGRPRCGNRYGLYVPLLKGSDEFAAVGSEPGGSQPLELGFHDVTVRSHGTSDARDDARRGAFRAAVRGFSKMTSAACEDVASAAANCIAHGEVVAWFQGRLEFGPRALGNRSLLADPRDGSAKTRLNNLKGREPFRPFAAAILAEEAQTWLRRGNLSPFMLLIDHVRSDLKNRVPAILHVDGSVRIQTVERDTDPLFHRLISTFFELTGVPMVVNTSLNVRGEPLARTPLDALRFLTETDLQTLFIGPYQVAETSATP